MPTGSSNRTKRACNRKVEQTFKIAVAAICWSSCCGGKRICPWRLVKLCSRRSFGWIMHQRNCVVVVVGVIYRTAWVVSASRHTGRYLSVTNRLQLRWRIYLLCPLTALSSNAFTSQERVLEKLGERKLCARYFKKNSRVSSFFVCKLYHSFSKIL